MGGEPWGRVAEKCVRVNLAKAMLACLKSYGGEDVRDTLCMIFHAVVVISFFVLLVRRRPFGASWQFENESDHS